MNINQSASERSNVIKSRTDGIGIGGGGSEGTVGYSGVRWGTVGSARDDERLRFNSSGKNRSNVN